MISNFYSITFPMQSFQIERLPYDQEVLRNLRLKYNADNSLFAHSGYIYVSPMGDRRVPGGELMELDVQRDREVVGSLVRHIYFRAFKENYPDIIPLHFYPFRILSRQQRHDLLALALEELGIDPAGLGRGLARKKLIEVQFRDIVSQGTPVLGAVITVRYSWTYDKSFSCESLHADGFNLIGRDVLRLEPLPGLQDVLAPDETLIGRVISISESTATVETNDGMATHLLSELLPKRSRRNIDDILAHYFDDPVVERIRGVIKEKDRSRLDAKRYHEEVSKMAKWIASLQYENRDGFTFYISDKPHVPQPGFRMEAPVFRFDYSPGASGTDVSKGLIQHGPYDSMTFTPKTPRVAILCHRSSRDAFTSLLAKLRDGIPEAANFTGGMIGKYRLQDIAFEAARDFLEVNEYSGDEYEKVIAEYLAKNDGDRRADLILIETKDEFRTYPSGQNPYYRAKARFMMAGIPTQFLKTKTIRQPDTSLRYPIDSIALQAYAKMGGVPFILPAGKNVDREIIIGVGNAVIRSNSYSGNEQDRVVGITTFFKADGEYLFGTRCREVPFSEYFDALLESLRSSLDGVASSYGWRDGDAVRLVFHVFKPMKNVEIEVVSRLVAEYPQYAIKFAFVTISERHPYVLFDEKNQRGRSVRRRTVGTFVPKRMTNWVLDEQSCLVQFSGVDEMISPYHGFSTPVLIRIHEQSTFRDLHAIAQQAFNFAFVSWRSFRPAKEPVTLGYANRISWMLTNLRRVDGWRPEVVNSSAMRGKKWFL